ncbi:MAG: hypothetical protein PHY16_08620 [Methylobacter sp.]|nr:hypothetical protein [Methylobacter sp.]
MLNTKTPAKRLDQVCDRISVKEDNIHTEAQTTLFANYFRTVGILMDNSLILKSTVEHSKTPFALSLSKGERGFGMRVSL